MSENLVKQPVVWVDSNEALEKVCEGWQDKPMLALDTEFLRTDTYYPIAGLVQVNDGHSSYLIDPKAVSDFYPFMELLDDPSILKILHSCSEDLEVFQHTFGCLPKNIFDTQVAGAAAGYGFSVGFANLVKSVLGVELPKGETRSDWLQRPLSESQVRYAAIDVEYLYSLTESLLKELKEKDRLQWAIDDSAVLIDNFFDNQDPDRVYLRFKSAWKLQPLQLAILKSITRWREDIAQDNDLPRNRVIKESAIYDIAQSAPQDVSQLRNFNGINERIIRNFGAKIISLIDEVRALPVEKLPTVLSKPLSSVERKYVEAMKAAVADIASKLDVPVELLMRKKDYEALMLGLREKELRLSSSLQGWRKDVVGSVLTSMITEKIQAAEAIEKQ